MVSKQTNKLANGVLSGVLKVSGFFTSKAANSTAGQKLFALIPGEVLLASLDGFSMYYQIPVFICFSNPFLA